MEAQAAANSGIDWTDFVTSGLVENLDLDPSEFALPEKTQVHLAVIGLGAVTAFHHVPGLMIEEQAKLVMVCDIDAELLRNRCNEWHAFFGSLRATTNYMDIVNDPSVDAVVVATPNHTHLQIVSACLKAGKHVLCEKPLGVCAKEAEEMHRQAVAAGVRHMTAFTYRFAPALRYLHHLCQEGSLGHIRHFRSQRFLDWPETSWGWRQYQVDVFN